jgi:hypothetical protein
MPKLRPISVAAACLAALTLMVKSRATIAGSSSASEAPTTQASSRTPEEFRRQPDNTFLTFPEWYLVYSPREYAKFIDSHPPSRFPYWGHLGQFWQGYRSIYQATRNTKPFNLDYHVMIWVIGVSTTVEYGLKSAYENLVGRVSEATCGEEMAQEDRFAAKVAKEYVDFLDVEPWYRFDYLGRVRRLWTENPWWGPCPLRKWERRYFLTSEYLAKAAYGRAIKLLSESSYGIESESTVVILDRAPPNSIEGVQILETFPDGAALAKLPRYQAFVKTSRNLAKANVNFIEIAGNRGPILLTVIVTENHQLPDAAILFTQPIMTEPGRKRIAFTIPVDKLSKTLRKLEDRPVEVEHIYDY